MPPEIVDGVSNEECLVEDALMLSSRPSTVAGPVTISVHKGSDDESQSTLLLSSLD